MNGLLRTVLAGLGAAFDWLARGETYAAARLSDAAAWCNARARAEPRWPQGP